MPAERIGLEGRIADTLNDILQLNERMTREFERINKVVGKEGKIHERANLGITAGSWSVLRGCRQRIGGRPGPAFHRDRPRHWRRGQGRSDLTMGLDVDGRPLKGEFPSNRARRQYHGRSVEPFASEVTRVAREVGTEGKLGGQADVKGVRWRLERPHPIRSIPWPAIDRAGSQHCRCDYGRREWRPIAQESRWMSAAKFWS